MPHFTSITTVWLCRKTMQVINWHTYNGFMPHIMHHETKKKIWKRKPWTVKQTRMSNKNKKIVLLSKLQNMLLSQLFKNVGLDVVEIKFQIRCFTLTPPPRSTGVEKPNQKKYILGPWRYLSISDIMASSCCLVATEQQNKITSYIIYALVTHKRFI